MHGKVFNVENFPREVGIKHKVAQYSQVISSHFDFSHKKPMAGETSGWFDQICEELFC